MLFDKLHDELCSACVTGVTVSPQRVAAFAAVRPILADNDAVSEQLFDFLALAEVAASQSFARSGKGRHLIILFSKRTRFG